jgi:hypothetical protein
MAGRAILSDAMRVRKKAINREDVLIAIESELTGDGGAEMARGLDARQKGRGSKECPV